MIYMRCKCGKSEAWGSMMAAECAGCDECNTTYASWEDGHHERAPHKWTTRYNQNTGKPYQQCSVCYHTDPESFKAARTKDPQ